MNTQEMVQKLADEAGVPREDAQKLFEKMIPVMSAQLKQNLPQERDSIEQALKSHRSIKNTDKESLSQDGNKILGHIFKSKQESVEAALAGDSGVDTNKAKELIQEYAPLVMGAIGKDGVSQEGLEKVLEKTAQNAMKGQSQSVQGILSMLDLNKNGSLIDDIPKIMLFLKGISRFIARSKK